MTRQDCMYLFYNLMKAKTKSGGNYAASLGYSLNSSGELDYSTILRSGMVGPFVVESAGWSTALPFADTTFAVYLNGNPSSVASVSLYDVYYYNANMRTVWVYRNQVSGAYTAASPSTAAPSAVTVGGKSYTLSTSDAAYALSTVGTYKIGDRVTLLLGMDGDIVAVLSPILWISSNTELSPVRERKPTAICMATAIPPRRLPWSAQTVHPALMNTIIPVTVSAPLYVSL